MGLRTIKICNINLLPGDKIKTKLVVNKYIQIPIWCIGGVNHGPTLIVSAGVHGCEYVGILSAKKLFCDIDPRKLNGQIIILPLINEYGFYGGVKQIVPSDGKNLNRVFPGMKNGTDSEQIAYFIKNYIYPHADFIIDLHGGDCNEIMTPLVFFSEVSRYEVSQKSREAAQYIKVDYRIPSTTKSGLYSYAAQLGIPGLLFEIGGQGLWGDEDIAKCIESIYNLMGYLGMICNREKYDKQKEFVRMIYEISQSNGFWYPEVKVGKFVHKGQVLGILENLEGKVIQRIVAKFDGVICYFITSLGVVEGDELINYGELPI